MFFIPRMNTYIIPLLRSAFIFTCFVCVYSCAHISDNTFSETVKISLREVGHNLLLTNNDSTSVVKPIKEVTRNKYQLAFEKPLFIEPDALVSQIKKSFKKVDLPQNYIVEVIQCKDYEVAYSYTMAENIEKTDVSCLGRTLKTECYLVTVGFNRVSKAPQKIVKPLLYFLGVIIVLFAIFRIRSRRNSKQEICNFILIGHYKFYPEQNKLIKEAVEINLSKKECELLSLLAEQPNQVIKREVLIKRVWEDNGVIVGRSLDTYISKLRKKLQEDDSIKITNIHGVGYKLELN